MKPRFFLQFQNGFGFESIQELFGSTRGLTSRDENTVFSDDLPDEEGLGQEEDANPYEDGGLEKEDVSEESITDEENEGFEFTLDGEDSNDENSEVFQEVNNEEIVDSNENIDDQEIGDNGIEEVDEIEDDESLGEEEYGDKF